MIKVLFLDIDGVLNCVTTAQRHGGFVGIDPTLAAQVKHIIAATGCKVVLSSTWRLTRRSYDEVVANVCPLVGSTPDHYGTTDRGCEVQAWLDKHPEVAEVYAILDDNTDFHTGQPLFKTSVTTGITPEIAEEVIEHLGRL
jgi:hypothetical protein